MLPKKRAIEREWGGGGEGGGGGKGGEAGDCSPAELGQLRGVRKGGPEVQNSAVEGVRQG